MTTARHPRPTPRRPTSSFANEPTQAKCSATLSLVPQSPVPLTLDDLKSAAGDFSADLSQREIPQLFGTTDGKAVGSYVERSFNEYLTDHFDFEPGNAARGIDFPDLQVDLKVTSIRQPQSSCPFNDATQKVYGLGYHLLILVYDKSDDRSKSTARLSVQHVIFIDAVYTADFQTTTGICDILDRNGNLDDLDAFIQERNLPLDEIGRRSLAERLLIQRPEVGYLTISNAQQWRLQYSRAIGYAQSGSAPGVEDLHGPR